MKKIEVIAREINQELHKLLERNKTTMLSLNKHSLVDTAQFTYERLKFQRQALQDLRAQLEGDSSLTGEDDERT